MRRFAIICLCTVAVPACILAVFGAAMTVGEAAYDAARYFGAERPRAVAVGVMAVLALVGAMAGAVLPLRARR